MPGHMPAISLMSKGKASEPVFAEKHTQWTDRQRCHHEEPMEEVLQYLKRKKSKMRPGGQPALVLHDDNAKSKPCKCYSLDMRFLGCCASGHLVDKFFRRFLEWAMQTCGPLNDNEHRCASFVHSNML